MEEKDDCQICDGKNGGAKGNENIVDGIVMCDYCDAKRTETGMSEKEIVLRWKSNDRYWASPKISDEMREWAKEHIAHFQVLLASDTHWRSAIGFSRPLIYRLRPDFEMPKKMEFEYYPIVPQDLTYDVKVGYLSYPASVATSFIGFIGYTKLNSDDADIFKFFSQDMKYVKIRKGVK